ncbi:MAG: CBS domain-containing protein [Deltaproteobacteria bacterium]|nr:CBS domain-containing protein [Deltaproteobacteria bacterium]
MLVRHRMTQNPVTVTPQNTLAVALEKMTAGRFRRLPVVQDGALVGILTDRDLRRHEGVQERTRVVAAIAEAARLVNDMGGEVLGVGTYRDPWSEQAIFYLRLRGVDTGAASAALQNKGYTVLSVH